MPHRSEHSARHLRIMLGKPDLNDNPITSRTPDHLIPPAARPGRKRIHPRKAREARKLFEFYTPGFKPCTFHNWTDAADLFAGNIAVRFFTGWTKRSDGAYVAGPQLGYYRRVRVLQQKQVDSVVHKQYEFVLGFNADYPGKSRLAAKAFDNEFTMRLWIGRYNANNDGTPAR